MDLDELLASIAIRAGTASVRALLAKEPDVVEAALGRTSEQFPGMVVELSLARWIASPPFVDAFDRLRAGERGFEDDIVKSFVEVGEFDHGAERDERAREVVAAFLANLLSELHQGEEAISVLASRQEHLHFEALEHVTAGFDRIEHLLLNASPPRSGVSLADSEHASPTDAEHARLEAQLDLARDLLQDHMVVAARTALERLRDSSGEIPDDRRYRLLTLLGACALAAECIEEGCAYLEEAHRLRPDDAAALANAAVAARLRGDPQRSVDLARRSVDVEPRDSHAAAVLVEALWWAGEAEQMEEFVATEAWVADDPRCARALAQIRAEQQRFDEAIGFARQLVENEADDPEAHIVLAKCQMLALQAGLADQPTAACHESEKHATKALGLLEGKELDSRVVHALSVRAGARLFGDDFTGAMADAEAILSKRPADSSGLCSKGLILLETNDFPEARAAFDLIEDPGVRARALLPHAAATFWSGDQAAAAELLRGSFSLDRREWDDIGMAELLGEAEHTLGSEDSVGPLLDEALERTPEDPRLLHLVARRHALAGDADAAESFFSRAVECAAGSDRNRIQMGLAAFYSQEERYSGAADEYQQIVNGDVLHPGAMELLRNLWNSGRMREALAWARTLREQHPHPPAYALDTEARILTNVGDVRVAAERWAFICSRDDATPRDRLMLAVSLLWCGQREGALTVVRDVDASELRSEPRDLLWLAQLKQLLGEPGYLDDAYAARRHGVNDASVHHGYFGVFMSKDDELGTPQIVEPGCAVLLSGDAGEKWWLILEEGEERLSDHDLYPSDGLATSLLGHRQGDEIPLQEGFGELAGVVVEIQSKYVRAFQETTTEFPTRFPQNSAIASVPVSPEDMTNFFKVVDDRDRFVRELQRLYLNDQVPFAFLCAYLGRPAPEVWRACTAGGGLRIRFGDGTVDQAERARTALRESDHIVLDMLALLTVGELGLAEPLRRRFCRITVPQAVVDELRQLVYETTSPERPRGYVGRNLDGSYSWVELSTDESAEYAEFVRSLLELAGSFEAIPSYPLIDLEPNTLERLQDALGNASIAAIFAGGEDLNDRPLLVSDDLGLASLAGESGYKAANTQAVLEELRWSSQLTHEQYSTLVARLATLNYRFVRVEAADIHRLLKANGYMTDDASRALIATLEGPECSMESAVGVVAELVAEIALEHPPNEWLLVPMLFAALHRGREMTPALWVCRAAIESRLPHGTAARARVLSLVDDWIAVSVGSVGAPGP